MLRVLLAVVVAGTGCASELSMVKSENHRLREQVTQLRADKRRGDRKVRELENEIAALGGDGRSHGRDRDQIALGAGASAPQLPVTVLGPSEPSADGLAPGQRIIGIDDDGTAIIYEGDAAAGKAASFGDDLDDDDAGAGADADATPPPPRHHPRAPKPTTSDRIAPQTAANPESAAQYRSAVDLLRAGHHDDAIALFRDLIAKWPDDDYADNAQYWLGEAYYDRKDYTKALAEFRIAVDKYPHGNKVPDALLKVGYCYLALGQTEKGKFALEQVIAIYPKTEPATLAGKRLESIGQ